MARNWILVLSLPLLVVLLGSLLSHAEGVDTAKATTPPRLPIAVEGVIYCRSCKLPGYVESMDASPLPGAVAWLRCNSSAPGVTVKGTTDKNGYFLIQTNAVTNYGAHKCRVFLGSSPLSYCNVPVYPADQRSGAPLKFERIIKLGSGQRALYTAGAFAFAPAKGSSCPRRP
ncbi:non-classical arabinogalactan protein 31-like [Phoenix dactylifera]|uniref:Non-classical arabinogalactan protein 31-like n=1 Tax=Phoenix dactylifera TaxID=42345 RepID=A0A8B9A3F3_PHODC|nr:non-classical arabinogalactan protein 31-like [Phoenix dactylifera]